MDFDVVGIFLVISNMNIEKVRNMDSFRVIFLLEVGGS